MEHLLDSDNKVEKQILERLGAVCGATAASVIRLDRSHRNRRDNEGLLFEQRAKWISKTARPHDKGKAWMRCADEFFGRDEAWGITGEAFLRGRIVDVTSIRKKGRHQQGNWLGNRRRENETKRKTVNIKSKYCEPIQRLINSSLKDMLVAPISSNNITLGALKLFNHESCKTCKTQGGGFEEHFKDVEEATRKIADHWLSTYAIRCEVAVVFIDVVDSTSFLIASGYYDGARVFQVFTDRIQRAIDGIAREIEERPLQSYAATVGGAPFFDKFTGDGVLLIFPYDRLPLPKSEHPENEHIWPNIRDVVVAAKRAWNEILNSAECRRVFREAAMGAEPLKVAISSGPAYLGKFGKHLSAIGRPLIEASRILDTKEIYKELWGNGHDIPDADYILASQQFVEDFGLTLAKPVGGPRELKGLPGDRRIFKVPLASSRSRRKRDLYRAK